MQENEDFVLERQSIDLSGLSLKGRILDVGGGGEGMIGRLFPQSVISIDNRYDELEEAPCDTIKIVMDACDMKFLDGTFDTACCFYTLMYIRKDKWKQLFAELYRVLRPGANLLVWDTIIPAKPVDGEKFLLVPTSVQLSPEHILKPCYGVVWEGRQATAQDYLETATDQGFSVNELKEYGMGFHISFTKLAPS